MQVYIELLFLIIITSGSLAVTFKLFAFVSEEFKWVPFKMTKALDKLADYSIFTAILTLVMGGTGMFSYLLVRKINQILGML